MNGTGWWTRRGSSITSIHALLEFLEVEWSSSGHLDHRKLIANLGAYTVIAFCGSFRGNEIFPTDLNGLNKCLVELVGKDFVIVPLLGRLKGEQHSCFHLATLAAKTNSGIEVRKRIQSLVEVKGATGQVRGPAFGDHHGMILPSNYIEKAMMERLHEIKEKKVGLDPSEVDVYEQFGVSRSFRRGATLVALVHGVAEKYIDLINRWRKG